MATATIVDYMHDIGDYREHIYEVVLRDRRRFKIKIGGFDDRRAIIVETYLGTRINEIAEIIEGCFNAESNFFTEVSYVIFRCERLIRLKYAGTSLFVTAENASAEEIVKSWRRKAQLLEKGDYYVVGVRKLKPEGEYDGVCFVLAESPTEAIEKASAGYDVCECKCFGVYNKKADTFLLNDAKLYLNIDKMFKVED